MDGQYRGRPEHRLAVRGGEKARSEVGPWGRVSDDDAPPSNARLWEARVFRFYLLRAKCGLEPNHRDGRVAARGAGRGARGRGAPASPAPSGAPQASRRATGKAQAFEQCREIWASIDRPPGVLPESVATRTRRRMQVSRMSPASSFSLPEATADMTLEAVVAHPEEETPRRGRPSAITQEVARDLRRSVELGLTVHDACTVAGIGERTYYSHCLRNPQFKQELHRAPDEKCWRLRRQPN